MSYNDFPKLMESSVRKNEQIYLQMVANDRRTISYGSTELLDAGEFLAQLAQLGGMQIPLAD